MTTMMTIMMAMVATISTVATSYMKDCHSGNIIIILVRNDYSISEIVALWNVLVRSVASAKSACFKSNMYTNECKSNTCFLLNKRISGCHIKKKEKRNTFKHQKCTDILFISFRFFFFFFFFLNSIFGSFFSFGTQNVIERDIHSI